MIPIAARRQVASSEGNPRGRLMKSGKNWFGLALILGILAFIDLVFLDYAGHFYYALMAGLWGLACLNIGIYLDLKNK